MASALACSAISHISVGVRAGLRASEYTPASLRASCHTKISAPFGSA